MKHIAKALAAQGRGPDTELMHVTPRELQHLANLAGLEELPRNPKTGLPEAGLFESILPIVGGIGGAMLLGPAGAAIGSGLGTALGGGSNQDILRNAAIGGIGAAGLGALGASGDAAAAANTAASAAPAASGAATTGALQQAAAATAPSGAELGGLNSFMNVPAEAPPQTLPAGGMAATGVNAPIYAAPGAAPTAGMLQSAGSAPSFLDKAWGWAGEHPMQAGILGLTAYNALNPPQMQTPQKHQVELKGQSHSGRTYTGGVPTAGANPYAERNYFANNNPYSYTQDPSTYAMRYAEGGAVQPQGYQHTQFQSAYQPGLNTQVAPGTVSPAMQAAFPQAGQSGIGSLQVAAPAGGVNYADPNWYQKAVTQGAEPAPVGSSDSAIGQALRGLGAPTGSSTSMGGIGRLALAIPTAGLSLTPGGGDFISNTMGSLGLGGFAKGGKLNLRAPTKKMDPVFLKGAGDGMSDSIPAYIDGGGVRSHEPIRVADGEYVVPADAVSHLGNGSSDAGAKQLDAMVARARKARTGKKAQAPQIDAKKQLPA